MALTVKSKIFFEVKDSVIPFLKPFESGEIQNIVTSFTQKFDVDILIPSGTVNQIISFQGIPHGQQIFFWSDQALEITLIPQGADLGSTPSLTLYPSLPSLLSVQNVIGIAISNPTGNLAKLVLVCVGTTS